MAVIGSLRVLMHWKGLLIPAGNWNFFSHSIILQKCMKCIESELDYSLEAARKARMICSSQTKCLRSLSTSFNENGPATIIKNANTENATQSL